MGNQHWNRRSCHALLSHLFSQLFSILKYIDKKCYVTKPLVRNICESDIHLNHLGLLYIVWTLKQLFGENQHFLLFSLVDHFCGTAEVCPRLCAVMLKCWNITAPSLQCTPSRADFRGLKCESTPFLHTSRHVFMSSVLLILRNHCSCNSRTVGFVGARKPPSEWLRLQCRCSDSLWSGFCCVLGLPSCASWSLGVQPWAQMCLKMMYWGLLFQVCRWRVWIEGKPSKSFPESLPDWHLAHVIDSCWNGCLRSWYFYLSHSVVYFDSLILARYIAQEDFVLWSVDRISVILVLNLYSKPFHPLTCNCAF